MRVGARRRGLELRCAPQRARTKVRAPEREVRRLGEGVLDGALAPGEEDAGGGGRVGLAEEEEVGELVVVGDDVTHLVRVTARVRLRVGVGVGVRLRARGRLRVGFGVRARARVGFGVRGWGWGWGWG